MLPADCSRRLVAELQGALDACAQRQLQLEQSLRVCRRLLQAWEPTGTWALKPPPGPETNEEDPLPACTPSPQDLKELEFLTQALEKAVRVRRGITKAGERDKAPSLKSRSIVTSPGTTASAPPQSRGQAGQAGGHASDTRPTKGLRQTAVPAKGHAERRLLSVGDRTRVGMGARAPRPGAGLRDQQMAPSAAPQAPEAFTLKEKGHLLRLPAAFRKAASQNSRPISPAGITMFLCGSWGTPCVHPSLWAQLGSTQTSDSMDATAAKTQFLQNMQTASGVPQPRLSAAEVEAEAGRLRKACSLLRLRMREELSAAPMDWMQEYRCLLTLEGLQAMVGQCLHRLQELRAAVVVQPPRPCPVEGPPRASPSCRGGAEPAWSPQLLVYSSTQELQTLAALQLRVAMLDQQIHLEKVLMAELLPLVSTAQPQGPPWLALCRAAHSLLCEGGARVLTILRDEPAV
ncbi:tubulin epsilon and delta complex protein 2 isoform X1 [Pongo abelii]|uniref:tubulin epsilon and delta complex protein 2 isoform X1 n=1 Tax=Pongo abelii TaxID=9601 RepID=UPI0023E888AA|nr:tubulin epsilon and delta complex protein 2 isoform X1 [Pongo abelii]